MRSFVGRLGLWRLWRNPVGRRCYELLQRLGLVVAVMVRYETGPATAGSARPVPAAFDVDSWRADDPALPGSVPGSLDADDVVVGATYEGELVGYCVLSSRTVSVREIGDTVEPHGVYLWDLYVRPAYRGRGLGTALLQRARADDVVATAAAERGEGGVEALVAADNRPSRAAFRSAGFEPTERLVSIGLGGRTYRRRTPLGGTAEP